MQVSGPDRETLRRLAAIRPRAGGIVVTAYLTLDPSEFAIPRARATAARSLMDDAHRRAEDRKDLGHAERQALKSDLARVRETLEGDLPTQGAHGVAVFASAGAELFDVLRLPRPVDSCVAIDAKPYVEPLVRLHGAERSWAVLLANRRTARAFTGHSAHLDEVETVTDDVQGQHRRGGTEQARRQRHMEHEVDQHLRNAAGALSRHSFDRLLIGTPHELVGRLKDALDTPSRERIAGEVDVDVEHSNADQVLAAARPVMEADDEGRERAALDRVKEGVATDGRAAAGLPGTLEALDEQRVQTLLIEDGLEAGGVRCPTCDWLGPEGDRCPADGSPLERREDVLEDATERALAQSAEVFVIRRFEDLRPLGGIGAVLRF